MAALFIVLAGAGGVAVSAQQKSQPGPQPPAATQPKAAPAVAPQPPAPPAASAAAPQQHKHPPAAEEVVHGAPKDPSEPWVLAAGGRIYDNWWEATGKAKPTGTHPAYPKSGQVTGPNSFRCKECHGWDYRGKDGDYAKGKHATGIKGVRGAQGRNPKQIASMLRAAPHGYTPAMLSDAELDRVARFVSRGQHDTTRVISAKGDVRGNAARGRGLFQTTCATCHGYDGKLLNWGTPREPEFIGTAAEEFPAEVLHKIRSGHPGVQMINLRAFPAQDAVDVLAYAKTLPTK